MNRSLKNQIAFWTGFASRWWFIPLVAFLAAVDAFLVVIPTETLLITAVLAHPKRWIAVALWVTFGSAMGATLFGLVTSWFGEPFINYVFPQLLHSQTWAEAVA